MSVSPRSSSAKFDETSRLNAASSEVAWSAMSAVIVGPSFVFSTLTAKVFDADSWPSDAVTVIAVSYTHLTLPTSDLV